MTTCQSVGVRQAHERADHGARLYASDRCLHWRTVDSRLTHHNEKFARLNPRLVHSIASARRIALKLRRLWRAGWRKCGGIPERIHGGESTGTVKGLQRNNCRVAGPRNVNNPTGADRVASSRRERLNRRPLRGLKLIEEGAHPR